MKIRLWMLALCVATLGSTASFVSAQSIEGAIVGVVRDDSGAVVPEVTVTVTNPARGLTRTITTDAMGNYTFPGLPPGSYDLTAERQGFRRAVAPNVLVEVNQTVRVDLTLQVGAVVEEVTVEAAAGMVESQTSALGQVVHSEAVTEIPLNARNYVQLSLLSSGVAALPEGGLSSINNALTNRTNTSVIISGNREASASWLIDGIESKGGFAIAQLQPSIDAIQEFKIQKSNYAPEFGYGVGVVNIALKSGTNDFHGSLFYFHRNDALDARNFFDGEVPPPFKMHQWGFSVGGPIVRDKTFFFGSYESLRSHRLQTIRSFFPDPTQLGGDFSALSTPIFDPSTGSLLLCAYVGILCPTPFPGNVIPPGRLNPVAVNVAAYWPTPNVVGDPAINHITTGEEINDFDQFHVRVDHRFSDNAQIFGRYSYSTSDNVNPGAAPYFGQIFPQKPQQLVVNYSHIFRPTWLNEFRVGYNRGKLFSVFERAPSNIAADAGMQNVDALPPQAWGLPSMGFGGAYFTGLLGSLGPPTPNSQVAITNLYQLVEHMTFIRGAHTIKAGLDIRYNRSLTLQGIIVNGSSTFVGMYTGNPLADYLLGIPLVFTGGAGVPRMDVRNTEWAGFVQDDWRATPKLTLNWGLRYEYIEPTVDIRDAKAHFEDGRLFYLKDVLDQVPLSLRPIAQVGGVSRGIVEPDRNNFGPRFGFAFTPFASQKTVIRGGYGVFTVGTGATGVGASAPPFVNWVFEFSDFFFPSFTLSDLHPDPLTATSLNIFAEDRHNRSPYVQSWNLTIQQELFTNTLFEVAYVGSVGHKLSKRHNANQAVPGTTPIETRMPYPLFGEVLMIFNEANSNYHALQTRVDKRFSNGFGFTAAYTWSKSIDHDSGVLEAASTQSRFSRRAERAPSDYDVPHQFVLSYVYELPFGTGKRWGAAATGAWGKLISGWQLSGITTFASGTPFYTTTSTSNGTSLIFGANRTNRICDGNLPANERTAERWFDTSCFVDHPLNEFGDAGRNILRQDGRNVWDISLMKNTMVGEHVTVQFRAEFFNAFNHTNFARPGSGIDSPAFGVVTQNLRSGGRSREIQFGLKILF
jgi:hypothetical protein